MSFPLVLYACPTGRTRNEIHRAVLRVVVARTERNCKLPLESESLLSLVAAELIPAAVLITQTPGRVDRNCLFIVVTTLRRISERARERNVHLELFTNVTSLNYSLGVDYEAPHARVTRYTEEYDEYFTCR